MHYTEHLYMSALDLAIFPTQHVKDFFPPRSDHNVTQQREGNECNITTVAVRSSDLEIALTLTSN